MLAVYLLGAPVSGELLAHRGESFLENIVNSAASPCVAIKG